MLSTLTVTLLAFIAGGPDAAREAEAPAGEAQVEAREAPEIERVAGNEIAEPRYTDGAWRFGEMSVETALPEGYPRPTPPDAIEIKHYPSVRRAEVTGGGDAARANRRGFMPLFRHIQRNDIAMTAPVEMDLPGWSAADDAAPDTWTMSFLYRTRDLKETGEEGEVVIRDTEPVTVVAIGTQGVYTLGRFTPYLERLETWLEGQDDWRRAGDPRWFGYNGPMTFPTLQWGEVQLPIERVSDEEAEEGSDEAPDAAAPTEERPEETDASGG